MATENTASIINGNKESEVQNLCNEVLKQLTQVIKDRIKLAYSDALLEIFHTVYNGGNIDKGPRAFYDEYSNIYIEQVIEKIEYYVKNSTKLTVGDGIAGNRNDAQIVKQAVTKIVLDLTGELESNIQNEEAKAIDFAHLTVSESILTSKHQDVNPGWNWNFTTDYN